MARLNPKLCLAATRATCLLLVCTAFASAAGNDVTQEDLEGQIAKLQKELLAKKTVERAARAVAQPSVKTEDGFV